MALVAEARSARRRAGASRPSLRVFALVAPLTFACQEIFERLLHDGTVSWSALTEKTFLTGLALQLPFALAACLLARALLRAAHELGTILGTPELVRPRAVAGWRAKRVAVPTSATCGLALGPRGPPSPSL
jgi:hypothetical protein